MELDIKDRKKTMIFVIAMAQESKPNHGKNLVGMAHLFFYLAKTKGIHSHIRNIKQCLKAALAMQS